MKEYEKFWCQKRKRHVIYYNLWLFGVYELRLFGKRTRYVIGRKKKGQPLNGPNTRKPTITKKEAAEMWGSNRFIWPVMPYVIK